MNVFRKVTVQSLLKNKTRTVVTIIGIILSAAMICAVTTFSSSFMNYARETTLYTEGNWHGYARSVSYETYEQLHSAQETEHTVYLQRLGYSYAENCENEFKPYIYLLGTGAQAEDVLPIHITAGRYPTSPEEILLPVHLYTNGGVKYAIGDTLTLPLGQRMLDGFPMGQEHPCYIYQYGDEVPNGEVLEVRESRTYQVVGFYERLSWRIEERTAPGYTALTVADRKTVPGNSYDVFFRMEDPKEIYSFMEQAGLNGTTNPDLLMYSGSFRFDTFSSVLYSLATIVTLLIMFGSVALIYNAFSISVSERTKQFGLLSSLGATKKQLRRMVFFEAFAVSTVGIPLGVLAGVGGIGITLLFVGDKFRSMGFPIDMHLSVSSAAILIAVVVALITVLISAWIPSRRATKVSAVEAIRLNVDVKNTKPVRTPKLTYRLFGLPGVLAHKHYKRNSKKYRTTVLSLFMSIVLFVSASAFTDYLSELAFTGFRSVGYDLRFSASGSDFQKLSPHELLNRMTAAKSVTEGSCSQERSITLQPDTELLTKKGISLLEQNKDPSDVQTAHSFNLYILFVDDAAFSKLLKEQDLDPQPYFNTEKPAALAIDGVTLFNLNSQKYETTNFFAKDSFSVAAKKERHIQGYYCDGETQDANGNPMMLYVKRQGFQGDGPDRMLLPLQEGYLHTTLQVGDVIYEKPYFLRDNGSIRFVYPLSLAENVLADFYPEENHYYFMFNSKNHTESYTALQSILIDNDLNAKDLQNVAEEEESDRNIITIIRVFSYGFIVLISLIAAANVFNTVSTNIILRRREFAMLRSVGMTQKDFHKMMLFECLLYGSRALLYGLPVACGVTYLIYLSVTEGYETAFHLPWTAIGIAALSVFLVVAATMMYSMKKVKNDNPIDALKNENL